MLRSLYWYVNFGITLLLMFSKVRWFDKNKDKMSPEEFDKVVYEATAKWAAKQIKAAKIKVEMEGYENIPRDTNCLFVSNHQSNFDTSIFMAYIDKPKGFVAKVVIEKVPILAVWMRHMNSIFLDRKDPKNSMKAIMQGIKILKDGHSLVIFPEGTRSKCSKMGEFKEGAFILATKACVPIVPVTIDGCYKIAEANKNIIKTNVVVKICVHPRVDTKDLTKDEIKELPKKVYNIIEKKLIEFNK